MPWVDTELDPSLKAEVEVFRLENLPKIYDLLDKYKAGKNIVIFKSRNEADEYILV
jgi:hypothetical protein